jgi:hypothetical protein
LVASQAGAAEMNLLFIGGKPIAFAYNYFWNGYVFGLRMGYDNEYARCGAGTVLLARMLRDSFERGDQIVDFGSEYLEGKRRWITRLAPSYHYTHFRSGGLKAQVLRLKRWLAGVHHGRNAGKSNDPARGASLR